MNKPKTYEEYRVENGLTDYGLCKQLGMSQSNYKRAADNPKNFIMDIMGKDRRIRIEGELIK